MRIDIIANSIGGPGLEANQEPAINSKGARFDIGPVLFNKMSVDQFLPKLEWGFCPGNLVSLVSSYLSDDSDYPLKGGSLGNRFVRRGSRFIVWLTAGLN